MQCGIFHTAVKDLISDTQHNSLHEEASFLSEMQQCYMVIIRM